ncbi:MAG: YkgJ family cysteine cluster protein, partial [Methanotrichaceae archaeon]|nr:YkgJ family cysteine cluster protein [Methanotrichaceae archaeon]
MSREAGCRERAEQLEDLRCSLERAKKISTQVLADQIREVGFACLRCGECCTGDDNSVVVFPFEVRRIMALTNESWQDTVEPPNVGEWDSEGNFHTLEWRIKKCNGSCKFYVASCRDREVKCRIYEARPLLCSTYPFYLDDGALRCSECRGLGVPIDLANAKKIAALLKERSIVEIEEAIALLEKYRDFQRGRPGKGVLSLIHISE